MDLGIWTKEGPLGEHRAVSGPGNESDHLAQLRETN